MTMKVVGDIGIARVTVNGVYEVEGGKVSSVNDSVLMDDRVDGRP